MAIRQRGQPRVQLQVRLAPEDYDKIVNRAEAENRSLSDAVALFVRESESQPREAYVLAEGVERG